MKEDQIGKRGEPRRLSEPLPDLDSRRLSTPPTRPTEGRTMHARKRAGALLKRRLGIFRVKIRPNYPRFISMPKNTLLTGIMTAQKFL